MCGVLEHLPLLHERVAHAAGLIPDLDKPPVMKDSIDYGRRYLVVVEHLADRLNSRFAVMTPNAALRCL